MTAMDTPLATSFIDALLAVGPASDRAEKMALYGQFVGRWEMDAVRHLDDGSTRRSRGEIHFAWALQGRAVQDVWITRESGDALHIQTVGRTAHQIGVTVHHRDVVALA